MRAYSIFLREPFSSGGRASLLLAFLRVVELLPPFFPDSAGRFSVKEKLDRFVDDAKSIRGAADVFLVANVKGPRLVRVSTLEAAAMLRERLDVEAAPVLVVRDQNRQEFKASVLTSVARGLKSVMVAWGDDYPKSAGSTNVRDYRNLAQAIKEASALTRRARSSTVFFAPVDVDSLAHPKGVALAKGRLRAGADLLLAQPPTTDPGMTFDRHASLLERAGLRSKTLLNVFPFKDVEDVNRYEKLFGWKLKGLHAAALGGEADLTALEKGVIRRLRREGFPGVYVTTRGTPRVAETLFS